MRYNKICRLDDCTNWKREDDIVCLKHYEMMTKEERKLLWSKKKGDINLALNLFSERMAENVSQNM